MFPGLKQTDAFTGVYSYCVIMTNVSDWNPAQVARWHRRRANAENIIKEFKHGFGLDRLPCGELLANAAYFETNLLAYTAVSGDVSAARSGRASAARRRVAGGAATGPFGSGPTVRDKSECVDSLSQCAIFTQSGGSQWRSPFALSPLRAIRWRFGASVG